MRSSTKKNCSSEGVAQALLPVSPYNYPTAYTDIGRRLLTDLPNPPAAQDSIAIIKHGALARSDGTLRRIERHARARGIERLNCGIRGAVLVANFHGSAKRRVRTIERDPVYLFDFACRGAK